MHTQSLSSAPQWKTNWLKAEESKGKTPLGKAATDFEVIWHVLREADFDVKKSSQTLTHSPENNCQTVSLSTLTALEVA